MVAATWSAAPSASRPCPISAISSARSRTSAGTSVSPSIAGVSRTATAPGPKRSMHQAELASSRRASRAARRPRPADRRSRGGAASATARRARLQRVLQPLVDQALMGGVLVDDDEPVAGLGDDVVFVDLGARRAERRAEQRLGRLRRSRRARRRWRSGRHRRRPASASAKPFAAAFSSRHRRMSSGRCGERAGSKPVDRRRDRPLVAAMAIGRPP